MTATAAEKTGARTTEAADVITGARERIDALDDRIIGLIQERMAVSAVIQQARIAPGPAKPGQRLVEDHREHRWRGRHVPGVLAGRGPVRLVPDAAERQRRGARRARSDRRLRAVRGRRGLLDRRRPERLDLLLRDILAAGSTPGTRATPSRRPVAWPNSTRSARSRPPAASPRPVPAPCCRSSAWWAVSPSWPVRARCTRCAAGRPGRRRTSRTDRAGPALGGGRRSLFMSGGPWTGLDDPLHHRRLGLHRRRRPPSDVHQYFRLHHHFRLHQQLLLCPAVPAPPGLPAPRPAPLPASSAAPPGCRGRAAAGRRTRGRRARPAAAAPPASAAGTPLPAPAAGRPRPCSASTTSPARPG
ncbi:hypothetical protein SGLAM104S_08404 [Streptomyces glaucescens]